MEKGQGIFTVQSQVMDVNGRTWSPPSSRRIEISPFTLVSGLGVGVWFSKTKFFVQDRNRPTHTRREARKLSCSFLPVLGGGDRRLPPVDRAPLQTSVTAKSWTGACLKESDSIHDTMIPEDGRNVKIHRQAGGHGPSAPVKWEPSRSCLFFYSAKSCCCRCFFFSFFPIHHELHKLHG